jgi:curved DNA-binding protein CbpA
MPVQSKDYYAVLGVTRTATAVEVKKAFRRLARVHHPDVAKNKAAGEMMFKEVHEAYEVLNDPLKRRQYNDADGNWNHGIPVTPQPEPRPGSTTTAAPPPRRNPSSRVDFEENRPRPQAAGSAFRDYDDRYAYPPRDPSQTFAPRSAFDTDPKNKMPARWFIRNRKGDKEGPFDFVEIAALLRCGDVTGASLTHTEGENSWKPLQERYEYSWARDMPAETVYRHLNAKAMSYAEAKPFTFRKIYYFFGLLVGLVTCALYFLILGGGKTFFGGFLNYLFFKSLFFILGSKS